MIVTTAVTTKQLRYFCGSKFEPCSFIDLYCFLDVHCCPTHIYCFCFAHSNGWNWLCMPYHVRLIYKLYTYRTYIDIYYSWCILYVSYFLNGYITSFLACSGSSPWIFRRTRNASGAFKKWRWWSCRQPCHRQQKTIGLREKKKHFGRVCSPATSSKNHA